MLRHIARLSRAPEPEPPELPFPEFDPDDLIEGPRISLRYGSAATQICVSQRLWRRTDGLPADKWHYQNRWRSVDDYTCVDCVYGMQVRTRVHPPVEGVAIETDWEGAELDIQVGAGEEYEGYNLKDVEVIQNPAYLNRFDQAIVEASRRERAG